MLSCARSRSWTHEHKMQQYHLSTCPCPSSPHVTKPSAIHQRTMAAQRSHRRQKSSLEWHSGGVRRIGWRVGWCSVSNRTHNLARSASQTYCEVCGSRRRGICMRVDIGFHSFGWSEGYLLSQRRKGSDRQNRLYRVVSSEVPYHTTLYYLLHFTHIALHEL